MTKKIILKADTEMHSGYRGKGQPVVSRVFPKGTEAVYNRTELNDGRIIHTVKVKADGELWEAVKQENS